jgi:hypothetical protein
MNREELKGELKDKNYYSMRLHFQIFKFHHIQKPSNPLPTSLHMHEFFLGVFATHWRFLLRFNEASEKS